MTFNLLASVAHIGLQTHISEIRGPIEVELHMEHDLDKITLLQPTLFTMTVFFSKQFDVKMSLSAVIKLNYI